jgi:uncharacterized protein (TIGR02265 family)
MFSPVAVSAGNLEACYATTDLRWRLEQIPQDAGCRGAFFNMLDDRAGELSLATQEEYRAFFRLHRFASFRMFPVGDYLTRLVVLAQIHYGADAIHRGMRELQSNAFDAWSGTMLGRAALGMVEPSLPSVLHVLERAYASGTVVTHTRFRVLSVTEREIVTRFDDEYVYIEHAMVGALEGVAKVCRVPVEVSAELDDPFHGLVRLRPLGQRSGGLEGGSP